jgi:fused signal recognition particle receptor
VSDKSGSDSAKPAFFRRLFGRKDSAGNAGEPTVQDIPQETPPQEALPQESPPEEVTPDAPEAIPAEAEPAFVPPPPEAIEEAVVDAMAAEAGAGFSMASPEAVEPPAKRSWWTRLREGLARSSSALGTGIAEIFTKRKLDRAMLEELEEVLIRSDLGVTMAARIAEAVGKGRYDRQVSPDDVKAILASEVERVLGPLALPIAIDAAQKPFVILVVGVNGSGKTTTIGKLAAKFTGEDKSVTLAAGDTFRAAAIAQLKIWGERFGCDVVAREQGSDAASLAYEAIEAARASGADILLMDTAGRLQNRAELMAELEKIIRVMKKVDASAPHAVLLVLDATVGQNAMNQVEIFGKVAGVTGLVMTKLDGTARGGILVAIAEKFKLPVHFIGVGETAEDLEPFLARDFAEAIAGIGRER